MNLMFSYELQVDPHNSAVLFTVQVLLIRILQEFNKCLLSECMNEWII